MPAVCVDELHIQSLYIVSVSACFAVVTVVRENWTQVTFSNNSQLSGLLSIIFGSQDYHLMFRYLHLLFREVWEPAWVFVASRLEQRIKCRDR